MKSRFPVFMLLFIVATSYISCSKQELFKSEKKVKEELQGTWNLIPIPRYDYNSITGDSNVHVESWTFDDTHVTIINSGQTATSTYSVNTSISKSEFELDNVTPEFTNPARVRDINGTWRIISLDADILVIGNDQSGTTGLTELEFQKKK
jgi:hypothetical protein